MPIGMPAMAWGTQDIEGDEVNANKNKPVGRMKAPITVIDFVSWNPEDLMKWARTHRGKALFRYHFSILEEFSFEASFSHVSCCATPQRYADTYWEEWKGANSGAPAALILEAYGVSFEEKI